MTRGEFLTLLDAVDRELRVLTDTKGVEYPQSSDQLANFKRLGAELHLRPEIVLWVYLVKHLDSIRFAIRSPLAKPSEPIKDRINDAILYLILLRALITESGYEPTNGN